MIQVSIRIYKKKGKLTKLLKKKPDNKMNRRALTMNLKNSGLRKHKPLILIQLKPELLLKMQQHLKEKSQNKIEK